MPPQRAGACQRKCRRNGLARVSATPGKTQTINYYLLDAKRTLEDGAETAQFYLVDLPGYGFAKTGKNNKDLWSGFISKYLSALSANTCPVRIIWQWCAS